MNEEYGKIKFPPPYVGYYIINNGTIKLGVRKKPIWIHRVMIKLLLGIGYENKNFDVHEDKIHKDIPNFR